VAVGVGVEVGRVVGDAVLVTVGVAGGVALGDGVVDGVGVAVGLGVVDGVFVARCAMAVLSCVGEAGTVGVRGPSMGLSSQPSSIKANSNRPKARCNLISLIVPGFRSP